MKELAEIQIENAEGSGEPAPRDLWGAGLRNRPEAAATSAFPLSRYSCQCGGGHHDRNSSRWLVLLWSRSCYDC